MPFVCHLGFHSLDWADGQFNGWDANVPCLRCQEIVVVDAQALIRFRKQQETRIRATLLSKGEPINPAITKILNESFWQDSTDRVHR
jgi:hypothetical protein